MRSGNKLDERKLALVVRGRSLGLTFREMAAALRNETPQSLSAWLKSKSYLVETIEKRSRLKAVPDEEEPGAA